MNKNCWEFKNCGRELGGKNIDTLGVCAAATDKKADNIHGGINGGRCCWVIAGTLCGGKVQGTVALKILNCMECDFYKTVRLEEIKNKSYIEPVDLIRKFRN
jgi:hypothetical protein